MWVILQHQQERVRELLRRGQYDDASLSGWGRLDELVAMMVGLGLFEVLGSLGTEIKKSCFIPRWLINNALALKAIVGEPSLNAMQEGMLRDATILRLMGCTAKEIEEGFDTARNKGDHKPFHVDTIRYAISKTPEEEVDRGWQEALRLLAKKTRVFSKGLFIMDSTDLILDGDYEGIGIRRIVRKYLDKGGQVGVQVKEEKGFKLVTLSCLYKQHLFVLAWRLIPINQHEITVSDELIEDGLTLLGAGAIKILLIDRGFLDGARLKGWKEQGIDTIVPLKSNMDILEDMRGLARIGCGVKAKRGGLELLGFSDLETLDSYEGKLNGLLVTRYKGERVQGDKQWGFITTLPTEKPKQVLKAYDEYDKRSLVENKENRELKQGWFLKRFPGKSKRAQKVHLLFCLLMFNVVNLFKSGLGERFIDRGVRRLRRELLSSRDKVIVYAGEWYGIFDLREFLTLLGRPPSGKLDNARIRLAAAGIPP